MIYQWYPGHMTRARREMEEDIRLIDLVIELVDARMPLSSRNPDIDALGRGKARLILLNKADLADAAANQEWCRWFEAQGMFALPIDARMNAGRKAIQEKVALACREKRRGIGAGGSATVPCARWWQGSPTLGNPPLSIPMPKGRWPGRAISRGSQRESSG